MILPENIWNSPVIRKRLADEASFESNYGYSEKAQYWFSVPEGDSKRGNIVLKNYKPGVLDIDPHDIQQDFAYQLRKLLQQELHFDGVWIVGWTHPPSSGNVIRTDGDTVWARLVMIWLDEDADPHYTVESDIPFSAMLQGGIASYARLADEAHQTWARDYDKKARKEDFGLRENQQTKAALAALH